MYDDIKITDFVMGAFLETDRRFGFGGWRYSRNGMAKGKVIRTAYGQQPSTLQSKLLVWKHVDDYDAHDDGTSLKRASSTAWARWGSERK